MDDENEPQTATRIAKECTSHLAQSTEKLFKIFEINKIKTFHVKNCVALTTTMHSDQFPLKSVVSSSITNIVKVGNSTEKTGICPPDA